MMESVSGVNKIMDSSSFHPVLHVGIIIDIDTAPPRPLFTFSPDVGHICLPQSGDVVPYSMLITEDFILKKWRLSLVLACSFFRLVSIFAANVIFATSFSCLYIFYTL